MLMPKVGSIAALVAKAIADSSAPKVAERAGLGTQAVYNYRDGRLPSRLAIPALAKGLGITANVLEAMVIADRARHRIRTPKDGAQKATVQGSGHVGGIGHQLKEVSKRKRNGSAHDPKSLQVLTPAQQQPLATGAR